MTLGAEPKKVAILGGLLAVALVVFLVNSSGGEGPVSSTAPSPAAAARPNASIAGTPNAEEPRTPARGRGRASTEFRPTLRPKRGEDRPDPTTIDPTLRLDVLAKLQEVKVEGPHRSLFDFGQPEAPKPDPKVVAASKTPAPSPLVKPETDKPVDEGPPPPPPKPQAPPVPMKFFGYISPSKQPTKRAFFIDGDEVHVVREGDLVKKRYKIVRIGINSVVVEDTQFGQQQTVPLEEAPAG